MTADSGAKTPGLLSVAVVDDDLLVRESIGHALASRPDFDTPRLFASASAALPALEAAPVDIALIDLNLGTESGLDCIAALRSRRTATLVVALTVSDDAETVAKTIAAGAHGYLVKTQSAKEVVDALLRVRQGEPAVSPVVVQHIVQSFRRSQPGPDERFGLSPAEWRVLEETVAGHDCKSIARRLNLSLGTVYVHNRRILKKLQVHSRLAAVARYRELMAQKAPARSVPPS